MAAWNTRSGVLALGLNMCKGPNTEFDKLEKLPTGKVAHVVEIEGGWARVDVDGDALIDIAVI